MARPRTAKEALDSEIAKLMGLGESLKAEIETIEKDLTALNAKWNEKVTRLEQVTRDMEARNNALALLEDRPVPTQLPYPPVDEEMSGLVQPELEIDTGEIETTGVDAFAVNETDMDGDKATDDDDDLADENEPETVEQGQPVPVSG